MKTRLFLIVFMLLANTAVFADSFAIDDLSSHDYAIYINNSEATVGKQVTLSINMKNAAAVTLCQTDIVLPKGITVATDDAGKPLVKLSTVRTSTSNHALEANVLGTGALRIMIYSAGLKNFSARDGEVATITLNIADDVEAGDYTITLRNNIIAEKNETQHTPGTFLAKLTIISSIAGDVNGNGSVTIDDMASLVSYLNGTTPANFDSTAADVNKDNVIDTKDVQALNDIILKKE